MKKFIIAAGVFLVMLIGVLIIYSVYTAMPRNPLEDSEQLLLVVSKTETANKAVLQAFTRQDGEWHFNFAFPVVIGKNGMAWGKGLHSDKVRPEDEPIKNESDGRSPEGAFELLHAYGYLPKTSVRIKFPYTQTTPDMACIDEARSQYYNMIVGTGEKGTGPASFPSHEEMLRNDNLYKYVIVVGHNTNPVQPGGGSCIFLHIWENSDSYTAGCTAMSEESILRLLAWLDENKKPRLIQLTRSNYMRLKAEWGLPDITI